MSQKKYVSLSKLSTFLDNLYNKFSSLGHKHTLDDITNYTVDSQLSSTSINPVQNKVIDAEFEAISVAMNALETAIDGKSDASHNHDNKYYTETEIDTKLASKSDTTHKHDGVYDTKGSADAVQKNVTAVSDTLGAHTGNSDIHVTAANKTNWNTAYTHSQSTHARTDATKVADSTTNGNILINGTETNVYSHPNSGVTAGTYKSVTVNAQGHVTAGTNPTTLAGYGITDAETKSDASAKLTEAKTYADNAANKVKNDLLNGAGAAYDTLKELGELIDDNKDAIDVLEDVAAGKANASDLTSHVNNKSNPHGVSLSQLGVTATAAELNIMDGVTATAAEINKLDGLTATTTELNYVDGVTSNIQTQINAKQATITGAATTITGSNLTASRALVSDGSGKVAVSAVTSTELGYLDGVTSAIQTQLDGKAAASHGTHVSYSTTAPLMDGTASVGSASTVSRSDHRHPVDTSRASKAEFDTHANDTSKHIPAYASDMTISWNGDTTGYSYITLGDRTLIHVSDYAVTMYDLANSSATMGVMDITFEYVFEDPVSTTNAVEQDGVVVVNDFYVIGVPKDRMTVSTAYGNVTFPSAGTYFAYLGGSYYVASLTLPNTAGKIQTKYLPSGLASSADLTKHIEDARWEQIYDSGAITKNVNAFSRVVISNYTKLKIAIKCVNVTASAGTTSGGITFASTDGTYYYLSNLFGNLITNTASTSAAMAELTIVDGFIICDNALRSTSAANMLSTTEGAGALSLTSVGGGIVTCNKPLSSMTINAASAGYYFGAGSRVLVWGCKA